MSLKCPICGKEYYHESKICQSCENRSINSELIESNENKSQQWNCGRFLEFKTLAFSKYKLNEIYIKIVSEPKFSDFKAKKDYIWNYDSKKRLRSFYNPKSGISGLKNINKLRITGSKALKQEINNQLIYE